jgi:hypothetical protein
MDAQDIGQSNDERVRIDTVHTSDLHVLKDWNSYFRFATTSK